MTDNLEPAITIAMPQTIELKSRSRNVRRISNQSEFERRFVDIIFVIVKLNLMPSNSIQKL